MLVLKIFHRQCIYLLIFCLSINLCYANDGRAGDNKKNSNQAINCLSSKTNSNFFSGMSIAERFQSLYDGSLERHFSKKHKTIKKESFVDNSVVSTNSSHECSNGFNTIDTKGMSVSEKFQMLRDGSIEKKAFNK